MNERNVTISGVGVFTKGFIELRGEVQGIENECSSGVSTKCYVSM